MNVREIKLNITELYCRTAIKLLSMATPELTSVDYIARLVALCRFDTPMPRYFPPYRYFRDSRPEKGLLSRLVLDLLNGSTHINVYLYESVDEEASCVRVSFIDENYDPGRVQCEFPLDPDCIRVDDISSAFLKAIEDNFGGRKNVEKLQIVKDRLDHMMIEHQNKKLKTESLDYPLLHKSCKMTTPVAISHPTVPVTPSRASTVPVQTKEEIKTTEIMNTARIASKALKHLKDSLEKQSESHQDHLLKKDLEKLNKKHLDTLTLIEKETNKATEDEKHAYSARTYEIGEKIRECVVFIGDKLKFAKGLSEEAYVGPDERYCDIEQQLESASKELSDGLAAHRAKIIQIEEESKKKREELVSTFLAEEKKLEERIGARKPIESLTKAHSCAEEGIRLLCIE